MNYIKECSRCKENLYFEEFSSDKRTKDRLYPICRNCRRKRHIERLLEEIKPIPDFPNEIWKSIDLIEKGYLISNLGRCKSLSRKHRWHDKILKYYIGKRGYPVYELSGKNFYIHRLLAIHFIPNPFNLPEVNHLDGNKLNFALSNLVWSTTKDNVIHAHQNGLTNPAKGEKNGSAKLKEYQVKEIFNLKKKYIAIAEEYNVSINIISLIKRRKVWKHLNL